MKKRIKAVCKKKYIEYLDIAKGIGILLVILGHCVNKNTPIHNWIFSFHMPLFFFISGYCFRIDKYNSLKNVIVDKARRLLVPYILFSLLGLIISLVIPRWRQQVDIKGILVDVYTGYPKLSHITSTWFLVSLFLCMIIWWTINYVFKNDMIRIGFIILSGSIGAVISKMHEAVNVISVSEKTINLPGGRLPLTIDASFTAFVFFAIGNIIRSRTNNKILDDKKHHTLLVGIISLGVNIVLSVFLNTRVNIHGCMEGNIIYFYIAAFAGTMFVIAISRIVDKGRFLKQCLLLIGKNTMLILGLQSLFVNLWVLTINTWKKTDYILYENVPTVYGMVGCAMIIVVITAICFAKENLVGDRKNL